MNESTVHWCLGELHIRSSVVTIYDILEGPAEDGCKWWADWKATFISQIPAYLQDSEVMKKKNIDPATYSITFRNAENIPLQGPFYRDCGIWVCIFLYRLSHNLSFEVSDPVDVALAYREQMTTFLWKYKKVIPTMTL